jgi:hypothetical protein
MKADLVVVNYAAAVREFDGRREEVERVIAWLEDARRQVARQRHAPCRTPPLFARRCSICMSLRTEPRACLKPMRVSASPTAAIGARMRDKVNRWDRVTKRVLVAAAAIAFQASRLDGTLPAMDVVCRSGQPTSPAEDVGNDRRHCDGGRASVSDRAHSDHRPSAAIFVWAAICSRRSPTLLPDWQSPSRLRFPLAA